MRVWFLLTDGPGWRPRFTMGSVIFPLLLFILDACAYPMQGGVREASRAASPASVAASAAPAGPAQFITPPTASDPTIPAPPGQVIGFDFKISIPPDVEYDPPLGPIPPSTPSTEPQPASSHSVRLKSHKVVSASKLGDLLDLPLNLRTTLPIKLNY